MIFIVVTPARQLEGPAFNTPNVFVARRALAAGIRRSTCSAAEATYVQRCDEPTISPPPTRRAASIARWTRLLLSSDLFRMTGWSVLR